MVPPGCQPLYFMLLFGWRLSKVSPSSMSFGLSYTVVIWKSGLAFFPGCKSNFSPWYLQNKKMYHDIRKALHNMSTNSHTKTCKYILSILFSCLYSPKPPFAVWILALVFQSFRNPNLTVPQAFTVLPALLLHQTTAKTLNPGKYMKEFVVQTVVQTNAVKIWDVATPLP